MDFFKNLNQLESKYNLIKEHDTQIEVRFNSVDKKTIKEFQNTFFSLNFQEKSKEEPNILISAHVDSHVVELFNNYIQAISQDNNRCLHFSSYHNSQLEKLHFKDYLHHFNSCFIAANKRNLYEEEESLSSRNLYMQFTTGEQIFNSHLANPHFPQELYESLSKTLTPVFHLDYLMESPKPLTVMDNALKKTLKKIGDNAIDDIIYDISVLFNHMTSGSCSTEILFGYPDDMLKHYISNHTANQKNNFQVIQQIIESAITNKYKANNNFFPTENTDFQSLKQIDEISLIASQKIFNNSNFYHQFYFSATYRESTTSNFSELILNICTYLWVGLSIHHTFRNLKLAFNKAKKDNKTLSELKNSVEAVNNPMNFHKKVDFLLKALQITANDLPDIIKESLQEEIYDNQDLIDGDSDTPVEFNDGELNDLE